MTTTANLNITLIETAQSQKEVTANTAFSAIDAALTETTSVASSDTPVTLTAAVVRATLHILLGAGATAASSLVLPAVKHALIISNASGYQVAVKCTGDAVEALIPNGERRLVYNTGATVYAVGEPSTILTATRTANTVYAGPTTGAAAAPTFRALVAADLPTLPIDVSAFYPGVPTNSAVMWRVPVARAITFSINMAGSYGRASVASTGTVAFNITKNGTTIATATFTAAAVATFTTAGGTAQSLAAGDVLAIICPAAADATLADIGFVFAGMG